MAKIIQLKDESGVELYPITKSNLVASYTFSSAGTSTGAIPVDINADGGIYELYVIGNGSIETSYTVEYNGITTGYKQIRWYNTGTTISAATDYYATSGYVSTKASTNIHTITMPNGYPQSTQLNTIVNTSNGLQSLFYNQVLLTQQSNITSIRLNISKGDFLAGTKVLIFKK